MTGLKTPYFINEKLTAVFWARFFGGLFRQYHGDIVGKGVFEGKNLSLYAYGALNPLKYLDPDGNRPMTSGEIMMAYRIFGSSLDYSKVDFQNGAGFNPIAGIANANNNSIVFGNTVHFAPGAYADDFSTTNNIDLEALMIHELAHVWQHQTNPEYNISEAVKALGKYKYYLKGTENGLTDFGFEQQGDILRDLHYLINGEGPYSALNRKDLDLYDYMKLLDKSDIDIDFNYILDVYLPPPVIE